MGGQTTTNDTALFVYGTLKRGFFNYARYLGVAESDSKAVFVGDGSTIESYPMVVRPPNQTGSSGAPQLLDEAGRGLNVMGEVYLIDESTLKAMDILEGVHRGRYKRLLCSSLSRTAVAVALLFGSTLLLRQNISVQFKTEEGYLRCRVQGAGCRVQCSVVCAVLCQLTVGSAKASFAPRTALPGTWSVPPISSLRRRR
eukprot:Skav226651  [mRNA]  locus=scaffold1:152157:164318:- [translate_table: standard]